MTEMPWGLYVPEPLLNGLRSLLVEKLGSRFSDDAVGIDTRAVWVPGVNIWPQTPRPEDMTLAGAIRARITFIVSITEESPTYARLTADQVRLILAGTRRGKLATPPTLPAGWALHTVEARNGHPDEGPDLAGWREEYEALYTAPVEEPPQS